MVVLLVDVDDVVVVVVVDCTFVVVVVVDVDNEDVVVVVGCESVGEDTGGGSVTESVVVWAVALAVTKEESSYKSR